MSRYIITRITSVRGDKRISGRLKIKTNDLEASREVMRALIGCDKVLFVYDELIAK